MTYAILLNKRNEDTLHSERCYGPMANQYATYTSESFEQALVKAESLQVDCSVVELVPRVTIRHERIHRVVINPILGD